ASYSTCARRCLQVADARGRTCPPARAAAPPPTPRRRAPPAPPGLACPPWPALPCPALPGLAWPARPGLPNLACPPRPAPRSPYRAPSCARCPQTRRSKLRTVSGVLRTRSLWLARETFPQCRRSSLITVLARTKSGVDRIRRHREGRSAGAHSARPTAAVTTQGPSVKRRRREAGGMQDEAVYTCSCGLVFHAPVSTSVGCPHCGGAQAW